MIQMGELTADEKAQLQLIALEKRKKQLEQEIEDLKLKQQGFKDGKNSVEAMKEYFKD